MSDIYGYRHLRRRQTPAESSNNRDYYWIWSALSTDSIAECWTWSKARSIPVESQRQFATGVAGTLALLVVKGVLWYWIEFKSTLSDLSSPFGGNIDRIGSAGQGFKLTATRSLEV